MEPDSRGPRRNAVVDAVGLGFMILVLLDYLRPSLLLLPTVTAGGDTPCHYPTFVWFHEHLLPHGRLHGWYPGAYLGQPLLLYYFPLPFLAMSALAPFFGLPVAFKLGTVLGVFLLPVLTYAALRLMGFGFPAPLLGAAASFAFLFCEENPIWGGTLASTLAGEFAYMLGLGLALLFLGVAYRAYSRGWSWRGPALLLALTGLAHGYAVLWAGLAAAYFLYSARRPARTLAWLAAVALGAFAAAALWLLPLLSAWGWTTPYDDPWITISPKNLFPPLLWPLFAAAAVGWIATFVSARRAGGPDHRLLFLLHATAAGAALATAAPALGVIDVRFVPFAQLAACVAGGATLGLLLQTLAAPGLAALGFALLAGVYVDARSQVVRYWADWNYTGLEAKELWPAFHDVAGRLRGSVADARVAVEYSAEHEKAGSIRMYETLPFFSGRSTLEGVYNQASLQTHFVYYLASELGATSPNPFKKREYSRFDTDAAIAHLRLFNVSDVVALSPQLVASLAGRPDAQETARIPPYVVFHLTGPAPRYVEPLAYAPVRSSPRGWREKAWRWFTRKPLSPVPLVFTDDPRFGPAAEDGSPPPPAVALPGGVEVQETVEPESLTLTTSRVGHPLLVKISFHPRWRAEGADGPYLVSPALMLVVPRQPTVRLVYARTWVDHLGLALSAATVLFALAQWAGAARRRAPASVPIILPDACDVTTSPRRWGWIVPAAMLAMLLGLRLLARG
jgi:6-pyruvoyl-tetrahydropterin synthase related domain